MQQSSAIEAVRAHLDSKVPAAALRAEQANEDPKRWYVTTLADDRASFGGTAYVLFADDLTVLEMPASRPPLVNVSQALAQHH